VGVRQIHNVSSIADFRPRFVTYRKPVQFSLHAASIAELLVSAITCWLPLVYMIHLPTHVETMSLALRFLS
jgi:hypothetical protein